MAGRSCDFVVAFAVLIVVLTMNVGGTEKMSYIDILLRVWGALAVSLITLVGYRFIHMVWDSAKAEKRYRDKERFRKGGE